MAESTSADVVVITNTVRQKWTPPVLLVVLLVVQLPQVLRHSADPSVDQLDATWRHYWLITFVPLYAIMFVLGLLPSRVELGETALVLRRPLRRRRVLYWRNIQSILVDQRGSRRRVMVYGDDPDGRSTVLPVPFSTVLGKDPRFDEKFHVIGQAWLARRGDDWEEIPPTRADWTPVNDAVGPRT